MYESFYGFKENPFNVTPDPRFIYLGKNHREAFAQLIYGVREKKGFIVITGEVGTGKTTLIHYLLSKLNTSNHTRTAFLFNPKLSVNDFIQHILKDLGVEVQGQSKGDYLHHLHQYLLDAYQKEEKVILIVDEAQGLDSELLEEIRLLSNLETSTSKLIQIVLIGQPELERTLLEPGFRQLRQRINMRYHLRPLSEKETKEFIEKRLRIAGGKESLFTRRAIHEVYLRSRGTPRLINILCDNSLLNGYALDKKIVDVNLVNEAAKDLGLRKKLPRVRIWVLMSILLGVMGVAFIQFQQSGYLLPLYNGFLSGLSYIGELVRNGIRYVYEFLEKTIL